MILNMANGILSSQSSNFISTSSFFRWINRACFYTFRLFKRVKFYTLKNYKKPSFILSCTGILAIGYVLTPTVYSIISRIFSKNIHVEDSKKSKRPDKYTTGFNNTANDCFANSTIQSLAPLWRLNEYFTAMINYPLPSEAIRYPMPLHLAMIDMLGTLQQPIHSNKTLSVWNLLHLLEQIHQGRISRNQHDAHELMVMIIDTLEDEYLKFFSFISKLSEDMKKDVAKPPHFPFSSIVESKLRCMKCKQTSLPVKNPMMMLELITPQISATSLEKMISNSRSEVIEGYSCLVCMVKVMILYQSKLTLTLEQTEFMSRMKEKLIAGELLINEDYSEDPLYKGIISSNSILQDDNLKSVVFRETSFDVPPDIIPIHLSRSIFADTQSWRNACDVKFPNKIEFKSMTSLVPIVYKLKSLVRHKGTHSSGHYECYRKKPQFFKSEDGEYLDDIPKVTFKKEEQVTSELKNPKKKKKLGSVLSKPFWRVSDSKITEVSEDSVLSDGKAAYMIIYER